VPLPPLPAPRPSDEAPVAAGQAVEAHVGDRGSAAAVEDLLSARTLRARLDLDDNELEAVCAALTPVNVGPLQLPRYRLGEVAALLTVAS